MTVRERADHETSDPLATVENLLATNAGCGVMVFDRAHRLIDAERALADLGIAFDGHIALRTGTVAAFVAPSDAWQVAEASAEAASCGLARRAIHLRSGAAADLHLIELADPAMRTFAIIVPAAGEVIVTALAPATTDGSTSRVAVLNCDAFGVITSASPSAVHLLGQRAEPLEGMPIVSLVHPDDQEPAIVNWGAAMEQRGTALRWRSRMIRADGSALWVEATLSNDIDSTGAGNVRIELYDISREVAATEALAAEKELLGLLTETLPVGVAKFDAAGRIEHANRRLAELLSPQCPHELLGRAMTGKLADPDLAAAFGLLLHDDRGSRVVVDHRGDDGEMRHLEWTIRPAPAAAGGVVCITDVTEADQLRAALEHRATTDALTGCLNRAGTIAALEHALATVGPHEGVGLLYLDLDAFKDINDRLGHAIGDAVLEVVASRLRGALRQVDLVGRLGGDEFVIIAPRLHSADAALSLAGRVSRQLQGPAVIDGATVEIAASIGVAWTCAAAASNLLGSADAAMYTAKQSRSTLPVLACAS